MSYVHWIKVEKGVILESQWKREEDGPPKTKGYIKIEPNSHLHANIKLYYFTDKPKKKQFCDIKVDRSAAKPNEFIKVWIEGATEKLTLLVNGNEVELEAGEVLELTWQQDAYVKLALKAKAWYADDDYVRFRSEEI